MKFIIIAILMLSGCTTDKNCDEPLGKSFLQFKNTIFDEGNPAKYFSHEFVVEQLDGLFAVDDDKWLLHNAKASVLGLSNYNLENGTSTIVSCDNLSGEIYFIPENPKKSARYGFKYIFESNKWLIDSVSADYTKVIYK